MPHVSHGCSRRRFLGAMSASALGAAGCGPSRIAEPGGDTGVNDVRDFGARGDGRTDDTAAIQWAIDSAGGAPVVVPRGTWLVDSATGIELRSDLTLRLDERALFEVLPAATTDFRIFRGTRVRNVLVTGGVLRGSRHAPWIRSCQRGFGVELRGCADTTLMGMVLDGFFLDGIHVGPAGNTPNTNIDIQRCMLRDNRRQGISVTSCVGLTVASCTFDVSGGTAPGCGIDIEPNLGRYVDDVSIAGCVASGNEGYGILLAGHRGPLTRIRVANNTTRHNGMGGICVLTASQVQVVNNTLTEVDLPAIIVDTASSGVSLGDNARPGGGTIITDFPAPERPPVPPPGSGRC